MNYEEKYNEILEWARKNKARLNGVPIEEVLPELAESEDEFLKTMNLVYKAIRKTLASLAVYAEDVELLDSREETLSYYSQRCAEEILKSLKPSWKPSEEELGRKHLEGYIMGREDTMREMKDFIESHFNTNKAKEGEDLTDLYRKEYAQPLCLRNGGVCTNPMRDCINCIPTLERFNTQSGTSTLKAEG